MPTPASIPSLFIGLMSGTSLDGVDAALVDFGASRPQLLATAYLPYPPHLVPLLLALHAARSGELDCAATVANQLAQLYATTVVTLLQQSMIIQCRVTTVGQVPLVTVLKMEMVTFVPQQESTAVGGVNDQVVPHGTVMLGGQFTTGGVVSCTTTRWLHTVELFVQQSVAIQNCS